MLKKIKAFIEPLECLLTTHGVKGPQKSTSINTTYNSQLSHSTKQCADLQKQFVESNFSPIINAQENSKLCNFLERNFGLFNTKFDYFSKPIPTVSWNSSQLHVQNKIGLLHNSVSLRPIGLKNVFVSNNSRNFSTIHATSMVDSTTNSGGAVISCLGFKPFSNLLNKPESLFSKYYLNNNLDQKKFETTKNANSLKKNKFKFHEKSIGHKLFDQSDKGAFRIDKKIKINNNGSKTTQNNNAMIVCDDNTFNGVDEILDKSVDYTTRNIQYYMTFMVNSPLWALNSIDTSISNLNDATSLTNNTFSPHKKPPDIQQLNNLIVERLREDSRLYYNHMEEITSILEKLSQHGNYEVKIFGYEVRVNFPCGMQIEEIENLLKSLGIDPTSPHFELEMINFEDSIFISPEILNIRDNNFSQSSRYYNVDDDLNENRLIDYDNNSNSVLMSSSPSSFYSSSPSNISSTFSFINTSPSNIQEEINPMDKSDIQSFIASIDKLSEIKLDFFKSNNAIGNSDIGESYIEF